MCDFACRLSYIGNLKNTAIARDKWPSVPNLMEFAEGRSTFRLYDLKLANHYIYRSLDLKMLVSIAIPIS